MSGASVFFYGRRSRSNRSFDDLGFASSSSSSSSSDRSSTLHPRGRKNRINRRHRHNHHRNLDDAEHFRCSSFARHPAPENEPLQPVFIGDCSSASIINREAARSSSGRLSGNDRLPLPVLLAKERLLQRLRGVSVSGSSSYGEIEPSSSGNEFQEVDIDLETNYSREWPHMHNYTELPSRVRQHSASHKRNKKRNILGLPWKPYPDCITKFTRSSDNHKKMTSQHLEHQMNVVFA